MNILCSRMMCDLVRWCPLWLAVGLHIRRNPKFRALFQLKDGPLITSPGVRCESWQPDGFCQSHTETFHPLRLRYSTCLPSPCSSPSSACSPSSYSVHGLRGRVLSTSMPPYHHDLSPPWWRGQNICCVMELREKLLPQELPLAEQNSSHPPLCYAEVPLPMLPMHSEDGL